jgi:arylsulfatase
MAERKFIGKVGRTLLDTEFKFEENQKIAKDAPNVLYIVLDDLGFAQLGCYGSTIDTPNIDRLAEEGLRYNNFHTTAICSATRASLLTGANHHSVGVASIMEFATGCSNNLGHINESYATTAEILKEYDYDTFAVGKWHLVESGQTSPAGPFNNWPLGKGFDRYYGFLQAHIDQYHPILIQDNTLVGQPKTPAEGYHLSEDLTDHALDYLSTQKTAHPDKPFFLYLAYGAVHAPHHAPKPYIDKYKGTFDEGWDLIRERWYQRQKELGIIPADAALTERNEQVKPWESLSADQKKLFARYMETFAGFLEHTDAQIGRVLDYLRSIDQLDNTLVVFLSDNGASSEGGQEGRFNTFKGFDASGVSNELAWGLENFDKIGGEWAFNHYPLGWAHAGNTPFQWYKVWSHEGGVRDPLIIRYPRLIKKPGGIRQQYHHVSDITPTALDVIGVEKPETIKGVKQEAMHGKSLKYTFQNPKEPSRKQAQYYEQFGNRAIYKDGWKAVVNHAFNDDFNDDIWELYHVAEDFSESRDVAAQYPDKLKELQDLWESEAQKYGVFPLFPVSFQSAVQRTGGGAKKLFR